MPSYRGYLQAQQLLASQGYVTVSISANGINGQDYLDEDGGAQARSSLVRHAPGPLGRLGRRRPCHCTGDRPAGASVPTCRRCS